MNIVVVGPRSSGKSTISREMSARINYKHIESDALMDKEFSNYGGLDAAIKKGKTEEIMLRGFGILDEILDKDNILIDLPGGAISSGKGKELGICEKVISKLKENSFVIGLLLFKNDEKSVEVLLSREKERPHFLDYEIGELKIKVEKDFHKLKPILLEVANLVVYTEDRTPEVITNEILRSLHKKRVL